VGKNTRFSEWILAKSGIFSTDEKQTLRKALAEKQTRRKALAACLPLAHSLAVFVDASTKWLAQWFSSMWVLGLN